MFYYSSNGKEEDFENLLRGAVEQGDIDAIKRILADIKDHIDKSFTSPETDRQDLCTIFLYHDLVQPVGSKLLTVIDLLFEAGYDFTSRVYPIHAEVTTSSFEELILNGILDGVQHLLKKGVDLEQVRLEKVYDALCDFDYQAKFREDAENARFLFPRAERFSHVAPTVELVLKKGVLVDAQAFFENEKLEGILRNYPALRPLIEKYQTFEDVLTREDIPALINLIETYPDLAQYTKLNGDSLLHWAIKLVATNQDLKDSIETLVKKLKLTADLGHRNKAGKLALDLAAEYQLDTIIIILSPQQVALNNFLLDGNGEFSQDLYLLLANARIMPKDYKLPSALVSDMTEANGSLDVNSPGEALSKYIWTKLQVILMAYDDNTGLIITDFHEKVRNALTNSLFLKKQMATLQCQATVTFTHEQLIHLQTIASKLTKVAAELMLAMEEQLGPSGAPKPSVRMGSGAKRFFPEVSSKDGETAEEPSTVPAAAKCLRGSPRPGLDT